MFYSVQITKLLEQEARSSLPRQYGLFENWRDNFLVGYIYGCAPSMPSENRFPYTYAILIKARKRNCDLKTKCFSTIVFGMLDYGPVIASKPWLQVLYLLLVFGYSNLAIIGRNDNR